MVFYKEDGGAPEQGQKHLFYVVRNFGPGYAAQLFTFTKTEMKHEGPDWLNRPLDEEEQQNIQHEMVEMGFTALVDYQNGAIAPDWLKWMGLA
jgi:hypothetical protein